MFKLKRITERVNIWKWFNGKITAATATKIATTTATAMAATTTTAAARSNEN